MQHAKSDQKGDAPSDAIERFLSYKRVNRNRSPRTVELYRMALRRLREFLGERSELEASAEDLVLFCGAWLHNTYKLSAKARAPHVSAVREFYAWARRSGHLAQDPARELEHPQTPRALPRVMTLGNAEKLMWAPDFGTFKGVRDAAMIALLLGCGLRASGLVGLNTSSLVRDVIDGKPRLLLRVVEKGGRERKLPVPPDAALLLQLYLEHPELKDIDRSLGEGDQVLFVSLRNHALPVHEYVGAKRRIGRRAVHELIQHYGRAQGIPEDQIHPHALRHLFGTELAESELDLIERQKLMGHVEAKSTEIYTHLAMRKLTRDLDKANPLAKIKTPVSDLLKRLARGVDVAPSEPSSNLRGDATHRGRGVR